MPKSDFNEVALQLEIILRHNSSSEILLHIFGIHLPQSTYGRLLLFVLVATLIIIVSTLIS